MLEPTSPSLTQPATPPGFAYANYTNNVPTADDDETLGYSKNSLWYDTDLENLYLCVDATTGAAVWKIIKYVPSSFDSNTYTASGAVPFSEQIIADSASAIDLEFTFSATDTFSVILKNVGAGAAEFTSSDAETFNGSTNIVLAQGETIVLQSTGANWIRII
jgi:hypothetical protein